MNEEDLGQKSKSDKDPIHKNFLFRVVVVFIVLIGLYYIVSPFQNCMREYDNSHRFHRITSFWLVSLKIPLSCLVTSSKNESGSKVRNLSSLSLD